MSPKVSKPFVTSLFVLKNDLSVFSVEKLALGFLLGHLKRLVLESIGTLIRTFEQPPGCVKTLLLIEQKSLKDNILDQR